MNEPAFDELLRRLAKAEVEFVVVGGLALNAWGVVRGTKDVDVVIATTSDNVKRVAEVAVAAGGHVQQGEALLGTPFSIAAALAEGEMTEPYEAKGLVCARTADAMGMIGECRRSAASMG